MRTSTEHSMNPTSRTLVPPASRRVPRISSSIDDDASRAFLDRICELSRGEWLALGDRAAALAARSPERMRDAEAALLQAIERHGLTVAAWFARDDVHAIASNASCAPEHPDGKHWTVDVGHRDHLRFETARVAAERAALALLARPWLADADFDALYAPFA
jgi:hypothetical protein